MFNFKYSIYYYTYISALPCMRTLHYSLFYLEPRPRSYRNEDNSIYNNVESLGVNKERIEPVRDSTVHYRIQSEKGYTPSAYNSKENGGDVSNPRNRIASKVNARTLIMSKMDQKGDEKLCKYYTIGISKMIFFCYFNC